MRFWKQAGLLIGLIAMAMPPAWAKEGKFFSAQINYIFSEMEGEGRTLNDVAGTRFDLVDTMGVDDRDEVPEANVWFHFLRRHSIMVSYFKSRYEGSNTLEKDLIFQDTSFPATTEIRSDFEFSLTRLHYNFRFLNLKVVDLGLIVGADLYSGDGTVSDVDGIVPAASSNFDAPFPVLGVNMTVRLAKTGLLLYLEASGTNLNVSGVDAKVIDHQVRLTWYLSGGPFGLSAGYRYLDLDLDVDDEGEGEVTQHGFYGGVAIRF